MIYFISKLELFLLLLSYFFLEFFYEFSITPPVDLDCIQGLLLLRILVL